MEDLESILVIDDDPAFNRVLSRALKGRGLDVASALSAQEAAALIPAARAARAVLDLNIGGTSGLTLIAPLLAANPACRIVVLTGYASIATAVEAIKLGATHYLAKPTDVEAILAAFEATAPQPDFSPPSQPLSVDRLEWEHIQRVLKEHDGNISSTARALKMHRRTLQRKLMKRPVRS
ncbi:MAG: response regulator transcription factor [Rhodocyclaceae bacterium]|jgi:two-component system response regulator RegA|nr:response regulator transcription factor [Rhodocyclaceae bacterium]MCC6878729.1 response regulator transcription factor [Rhodocyclaceae bacterium]MCL4681295.1 response regulator transcription factor [Rhodocyclaceae bacterium]